MDINEFTMVAFIILMIIGVVISFGIYLMILSQNMNKTDEEKRLEDEEQMKYLKNYKRECDRYKKNNK